MISVIIPLYNKEPIIERTLQSALSQDYDDFEVIVVNDGSTDRSADIVRSIDDTRIRLIEQENGGPSKARNTGVKNAQGNWIVFLDADDELLSGALRCFSNLISSNKDCDIFCCPYYAVYDDSIHLICKYQNVTLKNPFSACFHSLLIPHVGAMITRKSMLEENPFNEVLRRYEDYELWYRLFNEGIVRLCDQPTLKMNYAFSSASSFRDNILEDFVGHISFKGKSFYEKMCLYRLLLGEKEYYRKGIRLLYPYLQWRLDLYIPFIFLSKINKIPFLWKIYLKMVGLDSFN